MLTSKLPPFSRREVRENVGGEELAQSHCAFLPPSPPFPWQRSTFSPCSPCPSPFSLALISTLSHSLPDPFKFLTLPFDLLQVRDDESSCSAYIASGSRVYRIQISMKDAGLDRGKESLLIPVSTEVIESSAVSRCPNRSEIQSLELVDTGTGTGESFLGSVDSYGHLIVSRLDINGNEEDRLTYTASPQDFGVGEGSWAGLSFNPSQCSMVAVARSFCKTIDIYEQDIHLRSLHTLWYPSSLTFVQNQIYSTGPILATTEGCQLTLWDMRMKENGGCLQRICGSPGYTLYASATSSTGNIAVGGADRTVTIYDPRRWSAISRLVNCSKYEITGLAFSSVDPNYVYIQGLDYEVGCTQWLEDKKIVSFRGDSSWLGFKKCCGRDVVGGWCDSGSIFVADVVAV